MLWEAVALALAKDAGVRTPEWRIEDVAGRPVLLLRRFDREHSTCIPFLSAMSMLGARDNEQRSYLEFVDALRQHGTVPEADIHELWRRIVFNILISNTDDHLRNHGFLYRGLSGWTLSPAYDLNPVPTDVKPRILSTSIDLEDGTASLELAFSVAAYFELSKREADAIASQVHKAVTGWRREAASRGLSSTEIQRMSSAFEHEDSKRDPRAIRLDAS